jgi:hypothetical protein
MLLKTRVNFRHARGFKRGENIHTDATVPTSSSGCPCAPCAPFFKRSHASQSFVDLLLLVAVQGAATGRTEPPVRGEEAYDRVQAVGSARQTLFWMTENDLSL